MTEQDVFSTHDDRSTARAALADAGYVTGFSSPGRPELWVKPGKKDDRRAIGFTCDRWVVVRYPEPSCAIPTMVRELEVRDGICLQAGKNPVTGAPIDQDDSDLL